MTPQNRKALSVAADARSARAEWRKRIAGRGDVLALVLSDPPVELERVRLYELAKWTRLDRANRSRGLDELGKRALRADVNLMMPLGRASLRSREWLAADRMIVGAGRVGRRPGRVLGDEKETP